MLKSLKVLLSLIIVLSFCSILVLLAVNKSIVTKIVNPQPEPLTELYFEDHMHLPKVISINEPLQFSFTVHNLENQTVNYSSLVTIEPDGEATKSENLSTADFVLESDEKKTVPVLLDLNNFVGNKVKVVVKLINKDQTIYFWLNND